MPLTESQLREAVELGDESYGVGAVATAQKAKAPLAEITVAFKPPFSQPAQFRDAVRKYTIDGGILTAFNKSTAIVIATLEPGDLPQLTPGRVIGKFGNSTVSVLKARVLK